MRIVSFPIHKFANAVFVGWVKEKQERKTLSATHTLELTLETAIKDQNVF